MLFGTVTKYTLVTAVLFLIVPNASEAFTFSSPSDFIYGKINDWFWGGPGNILKTLSAYFGIGGGTVIVYDALNYNYFGVGPALRKWLGGAVKEGGNAVAENSLYLTAKIVLQILRLIFDSIWWIISGVSSAVWNWLYFLIPTITSGIAGLSGIGGLTGVAGIGGLASIFDNLNNILTANPNITGGVPGITGANTAIQVNLNRNDIEAKNAFPSVTSDKEDLDRRFLLLRPKVNVLRGRRDLGTSFESVKETFITTAAHDRLQCLPLVLCAIYADPDDSASPLQSQFKKEFRSLFPKKYTPTWASSYVKAANLGESSTLASRCQTAYPSCPFSSGYLKRLIFKSLDAEWNKGKVNGVYT
ncbi:uncharacterized protein [Palaemon carinicauda]|uniref:uncharacterized protein n=1 Tax=Palaemon carinicauda TaxID=392227 RepID=UPI0035B5B551